MDKIKLPTSVGHREYGGQDQYWVRDADKNPLFYCIWGNKEEPEQISGLLNELAELRQVKESDLPFLVWAQSYIDPARWAGHRLDDAVKTELLERDTRLAQLRAERDALKARVEEFGAVFDTWWEHYSTQSSDKKQDGWGWIDEAWANLKQSVQTATTPGGDE